jgi:hypothetical protein
MSVKRFVAYLTTDFILVSDRHADMWSVKEKHVECGGFDKF